MRNVVDSQAIESYRKIKTRSADLIRGRLPTENSSATSSRTHRSWKNWPRCKTWTQTPAAAIKGKCGILGANRHPVHIKVAWTKIWKPNSRKLLQIAFSREERILRTRKWAASENLTLTQLMSLLRMLICRLRSCNELNKLYNYVLIIINVRIYNLKF